MRVFPDWKSCEGSVPSQLGGVEDDATPGHSRGWSDTSAGRVAAEAGSSRTSDCKRSKASLGVQLFNDSVFADVTKTAPAPGTVSALATTAFIKTAYSCSVMTFASVWTD